MVEVLTRHWGWVVLRSVVAILRGLLALFRISGAGGGCIAPCRAVGP